MRAIITGAFATINVKAILILRGVFDPSILGRKLILFFDQLELTEQLAPITANGLCRKSGKLVITIRFVKMNMLNVIIDEIFTDLVKFLFILSRKDDNAGMLGKVFELESFSCFDTSVAGLDCDLRGGKVLSNKDVNKKVVLRLWFHEILHDYSLW